MAATSKVFPMFRPIVRYADFGGRATRTEFWLYLLFNYLVVAGFAALVIGDSLAGGHIDWDKLLTNYMRFGPLLSLFNLVLFLPNLAVRVRRLHDLKRSGWWIVFPMVVGFIAYIVFFIVEGPVFLQTMLDMTKKIQDMGDPASITPMAIMRLEIPLWTLMLPWVLGPSLVAELIMWVAYAWPGTKGTNRFGPDPRLGASTEVF